MFETLFKRDDTVMRYLAASLARSRLAYFAHCAERGAKHSTLGAIAATRFALVRHLDLEGTGTILLSQVEDAARRWASGKPVHAGAKLAEGSSRGRRPGSASPVAWNYCQSRFTLTRQGPSHILRPHAAGTRAWPPDPPGQAILWSQPETDAALLESNRQGYGCDGDRWLPGAAFRGRPLAPDFSPRFARARKPLGAPLSSRLSSTTPATASDALRLGNARLRGAPLFQ